MDGSKPPNKAEMVALVSERWAELQELLDALSSEDVERPPGDGWSAKVQRGHISVWEASLLALLRGESRPAAMGVPRDLWERHDTDGINASIAARAQCWPLEDVRRRAEEIHLEVVRQIEGMSEQELSMPYSHFQPDDLPPNDQPIYGWVAGNTSEHYEEHIGWMQPR